MEEKWLPLEGRFDAYLVSNTGKVMTKERAYKNGNVKMARVLPQRENSNGYMRVALKLVDGIRREYLVHRLVAELFIPVVDGKTFVNHIDGNKKNNSVENLEWCTRSENERHSRMMGLHPYGGYLSGEKHPMHKLSEKDVLFIRANHKRNGGAISTGDFAKQYNVNPQTITEIVSGRTWSHIKAL